jgi:hypothetical protein
MPRDSQPGRLLASAAKSILQPIGCKQVGRSRLWIADQRFWVIVVSFQPSSFSQEGSYLTVGVTWLWHAKDFWSIDYGGRLGGFTTFRDVRQFTQAAEELASCAAEEVSVLRNKFGSLSEIASEIARQIAGDDRVLGWPLYHAAVAAGLAGDVVASRQLFTRLINEPTATEWQVKLRSGSIALAEILPSTEGFRAAILAIIQESRALHRLSPDPTCLEAV